MKNPTIIAGLFLSLLLLNFKDMAKVMQIPLTKGYVALVDKADFKKVNKYKWCALKTRKNVYAVTSINRGRKLILMHRLILRLLKSKFHTDHKDGNGLNNRRDNIRKCTVSQNMANRISGKTNCSLKYKGVRQVATTKKYTASIGKDKKIIHLGTFINENDAAIAYNNAAKKLYGKFAVLNLI